MKKSILWVILGLLVLPLVATAVNITVPSAPSSGYFLVSTTTGAYVASSTPNFSTGLNIAATSTGSKGINLSGGCFAISSVCVGSGGGSGTVTSIVAGTGLNGGTITTSGTLSLKSYGATSTADTANQVSFFTSTNGTPWTIGGNTNFTFSPTGNTLLTFTNGSSTAYQVTNLFSTSASTTNQIISSLGGNAAGTFIAADPTGKLIATTTPVGSNSAFSPAANYASTTTLPAYTYVAGVLTAGVNGALYIDGNDPTVGQRILVKNESGACTSSSGACNNGLYDVTAAGSAIAAFVLTRDSAYNSSSNVIPGIVTYVISGTINNDDFWAMTSAAPITIGTTALNYTEVSGGGSSVASVSNSDGTLTISPTTGAVVASIALTHSNFWTGKQNFVNASSSQFTATSSVFFTGLTTGTGNGSLCQTTAGIVEFEAGANCVNNGTVTAFSPGTGLTGNVTNGTLNASLLSYLATSTGETAGQLAYWTSTNGTPATLGKVATSTTGTANSILALNSATFTTIPFATTTAISASGEIFTALASSTDIIVDHTIKNATSSSALTSFGISGNNLGTTTISGGGQLVNIAASSTSGSGTVTIDWNTGNQQVFLLTGNITFTMNATTSHPVNGGYYSVYLQQDGTGSRTVTWGSANNIRWSNGTTTVQSTANGCTLIGFHYLGVPPNGTTGIYLGIASSTATACI